MTAPYTQPNDRQSHNAISNTAPTMTPPSIIQFTLGPGGSRMMRRLGRSYQHLESSF